MDMTACGICGKVFGSTGHGVCPSCMKLLETVYEKARAYLRDNPKTGFGAQALASAIGEDVRLVEILAAEGRFTGDRQDSDMGADEKRNRRLLDELKKNLSGQQEKAPRRVTYGQDRHGKGNA